MSADATPALPQSLDAFIEEALANALASSRITSDDLPVARNKARRAVADHDLNTFIENALTEALATSSITLDDVDTARVNVRRAVAENLLALDATEDILSIDEVLARELAASHIDENDMEIVGMKEGSGEQARTIQTVDLMIGTGRYVLCSAVWKKYKADTSPTPMKTPCIPIPPKLSSPIRSYMMVFEAGDVVLNMDDNGVVEM